MANPTVQLVNLQRRDPIPAAWISRVAQCAMRRLGIRERGRMSIAFLDSRAMRNLNYRCTHRRTLTDVFSFRYDGEPVIGEIVVAPACARRYAASHRLSYREELARYVVHGLLHWMGHDDRTPAEQHRMRGLENRLLTSCGVRMSTMGEAE